MTRLGMFSSLGTTAWCTVYPTKYAHGFVVLCFVVVMQSFIMNSHEVFIHIHQGCFAGTGAIVRLPQCQWSKPDGYGKISQCITTTKHSKAKTVCIFPGIYCTCSHLIMRLTLSAPYMEKHGSSSTQLWKQRCKQFFVFIIMQQWQKDAKYDTCHIAVHHMCGFH